MAQIFGISFFQGASFKSTTRTITYDGSLISKRLGFRYQSVDQVLDDFVKREFCNTIIVRFNIIMFGIVDFYFYKKYDNK
ncbi:MAG: hypothetical protein OXC92_10940 [Flavobacteriaceae bacterium]|nr:hypothetical protein [Flavobacteriaceae bacterium]MCY4217478.1 hypothetical protein [Flavobacteriaceae bacterium]MCY4253178.1 hypothetical protein [Flavobacteriaceae bacterium]